MAAPAPAPDMRVGAGESSHGLSTWKKVAIALGVVAIVTCIVICLVVWIRRNRKRRQQQPVDFEFAAAHATAAAAAMAPPPPPPSSPSASSDSGDSRGSVIVHSGAASPLNLGAAATRLLNLEVSSTSSGDAVLDDSDSSGSNDEFLPVVIQPR